MKVIEQLVDYLCSIGSLSESEVEQLRENGFIPPLTELWSTGEAYKTPNEYFEEMQETADREVGALLKKLDTRERQHRSARRSRRKKVNASRLKHDVAEMAFIWLESSGSQLIERGLGLSGPWRTACATVNRASEGELLEILRRCRFPSIIEWLLFDPTWSIADSESYAKLNSFQKRACLRHAARLFSGWHAAQLRVCKTLADSALTSPGLFEMMGESYRLEVYKRNVHSYFFGVLITAKLLEHRKTTQPMLAGMLLPEDRILRAWYRYDYNYLRRPMNREELSSLALVIHSLGLSRELTRELTEYNEIAILLNDLPEESHCRLREYFEF